jgi:CMP-N,N'-diacetyllegionaminic acid synthase
MTSCLAIIPARGGSKGIPDKNLAELGGQPLIAWSIAAAKACSRIDRVIVSTDEPRIAEAARAAGAETPFLRPAEISGDAATSLDAVNHTLTHLSDQDGYAPDVVALLQPTSPFRSGQDLKEALDRLERDNADSLISLTQIKLHPAFFKSLTPEGIIQPLLDRSAAGLPRQALPPVYAPNGAIYLVKHAILQAGGDWNSGRCIGYVMPPERSIDIDEPWELELARLQVAAGMMATAGHA